MDKVEILRQMFQGLSPAEQQSFLGLLGHRTADYQQFRTVAEAVIAHSGHPLGDRICCPFCHSVEVVKNGHNGGSQRFRCKHCWKNFTYTTNTILFSTKKDIGVWEKFCECFINKLPLRRIAEVCEINLHTAFNWRHKLLDALQNMQADVVLKGVVESDETYFAVSYKGSACPGRAPRQRGGEVSLRGLSDEQVCVPCTVNHHGQSVARISNRGRPRLNELASALDGVIEQGSIMVTDSLRGYERIANDNGLTHIRIARGRHTNGAFNIQTVNAYHSELKSMVNHHFKGVATKYLNNYIAYHNFVNFAKNTFKNKLNKLKDFVFTTMCLTRGCQIKDRPAIPV